jgi:hypothetical protein
VRWRTFNELQSGTNSGYRSTSATKSNICGALCLTGRLLLKLGMA